MAKSSGHILLGWQMMASCGSSAIPPDLLPSNRPNKTLGQRSFWSWPCPRPWDLSIPGPGGGCLSSSFPVIALFICQHGFLLDWWEATQRLRFAHDKYSLSGSITHATYTTVGDGSSTSLLASKEEASTEKMWTPRKNHEVVAYGGKVKSLLCYPVACVFFSLLSPMTHHRHAVASS